MRRPISLAVVLLLAASIVGVATADVPAAPMLLAGVAKADITWHSGATGGQVANSTREDADDIDPFVHEGINSPTQGFHDRLYARALVLEDTTSHERFAYVNTDNYLQQNLLHHYVAEILRADALAAGRLPTIPREHLMISATHDHSAPYFTTPSWGVWLFVDKYDERELYYDAHQIASAIEAAEGKLHPVRFGAAVTCYDGAQRNIIGPQVANDGTPAGYPKNYYDADLTVLRFDEQNAGGDWQPYALWTNVGMHPESLGQGGATGLVSADYPIYMETLVEGQLRAQYPGSDPTVLFSQGNVGDVEPDDGRANHNNDACTGHGSPQTAYGKDHDFWRENFRSIETFTKPLANAVVATAAAVATGDGVSHTWPDGTDATQPQRWVRFSTSHVPVAMADYWFAGPVEHPVPTYCNQEIAHWFENSKPKDCEVLGEVTDPLPNFPANQQIADAIRDATKGIGGPNIANLIVPGTGTVQETPALHLQALSIGDVLLGTCPCEPGSDQAKNFKTRTDTVVGNFWQGYKYACDWNGDGQSWGSPQKCNAAHDQIENQFSKTELSPSDGFKISAMIGQANDYIGYIVTERQWLAKDQYRKELTAFGPRTANYVNTGLLILAEQLRDPLAPILEAIDEKDHLPDATRAAIDARDLALIAQAEADYRAWDAAAPPDFLGGTATSQPPLEINRLDVARFGWNGGSNWTDTPHVAVERFDGSQWRVFEDQTIGDVVTTLDLPNADELPTLATRPWPWTAHWETTLGTPVGTYRFHVTGNHRELPGVTEPYELFSDTFKVFARTYAISNVGRSGGTVTFIVDSGVPQTLTHAGLVYYDDTFGYADHPDCMRCTFRVRPVAATITTATVNGSPATQSPDGSWTANDPGGALTISASDADGNSVIANVS
ncbi:MAG: neutral/alkaline non-lysosomal ceramidase N-terminal domain-containing protein [Actinomycetota bacterium]